MLVWVFLILLLGSLYGWWCTNGFKANFGVKMKRRKKVKILSRWTTSHECEACDKQFCGAMAALIELDDGRNRIICVECAKNLPKAQEQILNSEANK